MLKMWPTEYQIQNLIKYKFKHKMKISMKINPNTNYVLSKVGDILWSWRFGQWKIKSGAVADFSIDSNSIHIENIFF